MPTASSQQQPDADLSTRLRRPGRLYPPYAEPREQTRRWNLCEDTAEAMSAFFEPSGIADPVFVWSMTRTLYKSDIPTDEPVNEAQDDLTRSASASAVAATVDDASREEA